MLDELMMTALPRRPLPWSARRPRRKVGTATDTEETEIAAFGLGADDWLRKPIHEKRLLARVKRLLKSRYH